MRIGILIAIAAWSACGCGWNPSRPFDRESPAVKEAVSDLTSGDAGSATSRLEDYLSTGACKDGSIGTPDILKKRADGTFDLGLALFRIGERFGRRFGEEEIDGGMTGDQRDQRHAQVECARRVVQAIGDDPASSIELRARAHYLEGNLAFLDGAYEDAVHAYDGALVLAPAAEDASDPVGRDAAWNRAIALRRIEDKKDAGSDASQDGSPPDAAGDGAQNPGDAGSGQDAANDNKGRDGGDTGHDAGNDGPEPQSTPPDAGSEPPEAGAQPPPAGTSEDERMLDQLENAPTLQQEEAKRHGKKRVRGMADK
jgi:hypothetical protein